MYNKLFTKILDSSIWLEETPTRLVWITVLAAMDEDGMCQFASVGNLAHRARIATADCAAAVACLESEDENSSDPEHGGRRIERVPGGWMVLNAVKYRELVTREVAKERTRIRVARHREKVRTCNAPVTAANDSVTQSEAVTEAEAKAEAKTPTTEPEGFADFWQAYPRHVGKGNARKAWKALGCAKMMPQILVAIRACKISADWTKEAGKYIPHPATWLNREGWNDEMPPPSATSAGLDKSKSVGLRPGDEPKVWKA